MALNALFTGSSALSANGNVLDVVGNNLANLNTIGFKAQRVQFKDLLYQSVQAGTALSGNIGSTNPQQIGFGVQIGSIDTMFNAGSSTATGRDLDISLAGNGFFVVNDGQRDLFTRSGAFAVDSNGFLTDSNTGFRVQRFGSAGEGGVGIPGFQTVGDLRIRVPFNATAPGLPTTTVNYQGNLSAAAVVGNSFDTAIQVFDSQSNQRAFTLTFTKTAANTFSLSATVGGGTVTFPSGNTVTFDANGLIQTPSQITVNLNGLPAPQTLTLNLGTPGQSVGVTQFGGPSTTGAITQDGSGAGTLNSINVDQSGVLQGIFTNGRVLPLAQLGIANFANIGGLNREGNNYFSTSSASGEALIGTAGTGGRGLTSRGSLEGSNVDISIEFSRLIIAQRGFQVNTRTISAANEVLQDLANILR
jgi:flagellar hook protein FlgE